MKSQFSSTVMVADGPDGETLRLQVARLNVLKGPDAGASAEVGGDAVLIGTGAGCQLRLSDPTVSSRHAEIRPTERGYLLVDLGSKNGLYVNGLRAERVYLVPGVQVYLGSSLLEVQDLGRVEEHSLSAQRQFGRLVGGSVAMRRLYATLEGAARTELTVLLEGETGTGKGLVAEEIHRHGPRADGPFQVLDCGAVPAELMEAQLFGHERGAFTGAVSRNVGLAEAASGGTLFLDEIGELPAELQTKLLRLIESQEFCRVGDPRRRRADLRFIAATNVELDRAVLEGTFRQDLFYRLAVVRLRVPPLRDRLEDIPVLVDAMARSLSSQPPPAALRRLLPLLANHAWPGNLRELRNVVERLTLLPVEEAAPTDVRPMLADGADPFTYHDARERALDQFERSYLTNLLRQSGGNVTRAAEMAGVSRRYITQLMSKHDVDRREFVDC